MQGLLPEKSGTNGKIKNGVFGEPALQKHGNGMALCRDCNPLFNQPSVSASTRLPEKYFSRSFGFSIFPVGLRGTCSKKILRGRL